MKSDGQNMMNMYDTIKCMLLIPGDTSHALVHVCVYTRRKLDMRLTYLIIITPGPKEANGVTPFCF